METCYENQLLLDNYYEDFSNPPFTNTRLQEKFQNLKLYIDKDEIVHIKYPFCPKCGSKNCTNHGTSLKVTYDLLNNRYYFYCQRYLCLRCNSPYSAYIKNILVYDEMEIYDAIIEELNSTINQQIKANDEIYNLGAKIFDLLQTIIYNNIEVELSSRAQYKKDDILELLIRNSLSTNFLETTRNLMNLNTTFYHPPSSDTVLLYIGNKKRGDIKTEFDIIFRNLIAYYHHLGILTEAIDIAIDIHEKAYYGKLRNQDVIKSKQKDGTSYFHKFLTVDSVKPNNRFTLCGSHFTQFEDRFRVFQNLLSFLKQNKIKVRRLYVDREFFNSSVTDYLINNSIQFVMPAKRLEPLIETADELWKKGEYVFEYRFYEGKKNESQPFTVFLLKNEDYDPSKPARKGNEEYYLFATNIAIKTSDHKASTMKYNEKYSGEERADLADYYRNRWGIETDYRVLEHNFQGKTTSNNFSIRLYNFLSGVTLRNLWELSKLLFKEYYKHLFPKQVMTAKLWCKIVEKYLDARRVVQGLSSLRDKLAIAMS